RGVDGSATMTSSAWFCWEKKVFASSIWIALRGSSNVRETRSPKPRAATVIAVSISTVSTRSMDGLPSSVWGVSAALYRWAAEQRVGREPGPEPDVRDPPRIGLVGERQGPCHRHRDLVEHRRARRVHLDARVRLAVRGDRDLAAAHDETDARGLAVLIREHFRAPVELRGAVA